MFLYLKTTDSVVQHRRTLWLSGSFKSSFRWRRVFWKGNSGSPALIDEVKTVRTITKHSVCVEHDFNVQTRRESVRVAPRRHLQGTRRDIRSGDLPSNIYSPYSITDHRTFSDFFVSSLNSPRSCLDSTDITQGLESLLYSRLLRASKFSCDHLDLNYWSYFFVLFCFWKYMEIF